MFQQFITKLIDQFFPQTCIFCKSGTAICCDKCFSAIPQNFRFHYNILSLYYFSEPKINKLIWQMKYHHTGEIARLFGPGLAIVLSENLLRKFSLKTRLQIYLIPIPLNQNDKRLHNHAELLAKEIQNNLIPSPNFQIKILNNLLIKNSKQKQSHTKSRTERFENIKNAFSISTSPNLSLQRRGIVPEVQSEQIKNICIIVDDVTTSNATINAARKILSQHLEIPEQEILAITIAH